MILLQSAGLATAVQELQQGKLGLAALDALLSFAPNMLTVAQQIEALTNRLGGYVRPWNYKTVVLYRANKTAISDLDLVQRRLITEDKTANFPSGTPREKIADWAGQKIYLDTVDKINALKTDAAFTGPMDPGQPFTSLESIQGIRNFHFRIISTDIFVQLEVNRQIANLKMTFPDWNFSASFGN